MKFVGKHLNKGGKITDLPYFIKWYTILLHITCLILYLRLLATFLVTTCETQMISNLLMPELASTITLFLPSTTRDWNSLSVETKQSEYVNSFKHLLTKGKSTVPDHYYIGSRKAQILHTRIRTNCSSLNLDLFVKNITESPLCRCGSIENAQHFFFYCKYFEVQRRELLNAISPYVNPSLKLLLTGDSTLSPQINNEITLKVHTCKYIIDTHRF